MNNLFKATVWAALAATTGCASISHTPPSTRNVETGRVYNLPYDRAWTEAVDWFAGTNIKIEKIEKSSGLLTAKYSLAAPKKYLDCGTFEVTGNQGGVNIERQGDLNVTVRKVDELRTRVNVNFFGEFRLYTSDAWDGRPISRSGRCVSTGLLEYSILNSIY